MKMTPAEIERANALIEFGQLELPLGHDPAAAVPPDEDIEEQDAIEEQS